MFIIMLDAVYRHEVKAITNTLNEAILLANKASDLEPDRHHDVIVLELPKDTLVEDGVEVHRVSRLEDLH